MVRGSQTGEYIDPMFSALLKRISAAVPSQCEICHAWPSQSVCQDCINRFGQPLLRCQTCALKVPGGRVPQAEAPAADSPLDFYRCGACITHPTALSLCLAAVSYEYPWAVVISQFKFHGRPAWAAQMAHVMRSNLAVQPALDSADVVIPMPLSGARLRARGYNQALVLARALSATKLDSNLLIRIRETPAQSLLDREDRLRAMTDAFAVEPLLAHRLRGKRVVLVDDVMTTGATLQGAATALRRAGASHITGLVFARTEVD